MVIVVTYLLKGYLNSLCSWTFIVSFFCYTNYIIIQILTSQDEEFFYTSL